MGLENIGVETDSKGRIVIDAEFNTSAKGVKCIGDVTFGPMLAHKAEEEGIAAAEYIHSGFGHVNYGAIALSLTSLNVEKDADWSMSSVHTGAIPSVVYTHPGKFHSFFPLSVPKLSLTPPLN